MTIMSTALRKCVQLVCVVSLVTAWHARADAPPPEEALNGRLVEFVKATVQAMPFTETWTVPADNTGRSSWVYTRRLEFGTNNRGTVVVSRRHSTTNTVEVVSNHDFTYDFEDRMVPDLNPGIESIRLLLRAPKDFVQRDGTTKTVDTELEYRPSITWLGFETDHTDTDDAYNLTLDRRPLAPSAPPFSIDGLGKLTRVMATDDAQRQDYARGIEARRQWWLHCVQQTPAFKSLCVGEFSDQSERRIKKTLVGQTVESHPHDRNEADSRVRIVINEMSELRLEYYRNEPASWVNRKNVDKVFEGTLVDILTTIPKDDVTLESILNGFSHMSGKQLRATESLTLIYQDRSGSSRAVICCHVDEEAGVRYAKFAILNKNHDVWTADSEWWAPGTTGVGVKGQALRKLK